MKKHIYLTVLSMFILCGCGHNFYFETENIGAAVRVPLPEGGEIGVMVGSTKTVSATVRGGSSFTTESAHGAGIFSDHGVAKITQFKSNTQVNEGNIVKILTSTNVSEDVKLSFVKNLGLKAEAPDFKPNVLQTRASVIGSHDADLKDVKPFASTGLDKVTETIPEVVKPVVEAVENVTETVVDGVVPQPGKTIVKTAENIRKSLTNIVTIAAILIAFGLILVFRTGKKHKKKKKTEVHEDENPPDLISPGDTVSPIEETSQDTDPFVHAPHKKKKMNLLAVGILILVMWTWKFLPLSTKIGITRWLATTAYEMRHKLARKKKKSPSSTSK